MGNRQINPFDITKAVDFTDQQINDYWVDMEGGSFFDIVRPSSAMPMMILGGKGSGKTHLMRYFSYAVQKIRHEDCLLEGLNKDGYIGIYMRCGALNHPRFGGLDKDFEKWAGIFSYYMDLWLSQITIKTIIDVYKSEDKILKCEKDICKKIFDIFLQINDKNQEGECKLEYSLESVLGYLFEAQKKVDVAVNNYPFSSDLDIEIPVSPGKLIFEIPKILIEAEKDLKELKFVYLIDEFENLYEQHQKYINTLVREKESPCSFKVGSRLYGIKTYETYSADEVNKEGSEYEVLLLDELLRGKTKKQYKEFAKSLCLRRLKESGYIYSDDSRIVGGLSNLDFFFEETLKDKLSKYDTEFINKKYLNKVRPYFVSLEKKLKSGMLSGCSLDVKKESDVIKIIEYLSYPKYPIIEKVNILLFYKSWYAGKDLIEEAKAINDCCIEHQDNVLEFNPHKTNIDHHRSDLLAQLYRECDHKQRYIGLDVFIGMSSGLPRNLLIILKHIFQWSLYNGEQPFLDQRKITMQSQRKGVLESSEWFFRDARMSGADGRVVRESIERLATLFRNIRFSDKPSECSLSTFSVDLSKVSDESQRIIELAENWSLLINISGGQRDRNTAQVNMKYQINPMLAPRWDLPVSRRGVISLKPEEIDSIFDFEKLDDYEKYSKDRVTRMNAPCFSKEKSRSYGNVKQQGILFGDDDV